MRRGDADAAAELERPSVENERGHAASNSPPDDAVPASSQPVVARSEAPVERPAPSIDDPGKASPQPEAATAPEKPQRFFRRHLLATSIVAVVLVVVVVAGTLWWLHARNYENTDDAFIDARTVPISAQVSGAVVEVPVTDNQRVEAGAVLARIDARDYQAALDQAKAQVEQAQASIANYEAQIVAQQSRITQANKQVAQAQAALKFSQEENQRYQELLRRGAGTEQRAQQAASDLQQRQATAASAEAAVTEAEKQVAVLKAQRTAAVSQVAQAQAAVEQAEANLSRTVIKAPVDGRVAKLTAAKGAFAQPGQTVMVFVPNDVWVTANFKETQLALMRPGQPVDISVDAYPDRQFEGHVDSIQAGSGTAFSLLPAENATGNYVKVVQRVPVKIVFNQPPEVALGPGMSVVPTVKVR